MMEIWREKVPIRFGSIDRSDRLTLWSIFNFFQEAAISHATELDVGRDAMASTGQAWILSRLSILAERRPRYGEIVQVSTWPRRWEKLFAMRDYEIRDAEDRAVVRGRGAWLVLDVEKRRPLRAQNIMEKLPHNDGIDALAPNEPGSSSAALNSRENLLKCGSRTALYSDIDNFGHVNNARYIQWIQDITAMDVLTNAEQIRFSINYLSEVLPVETVDFWMGPLEDANDENTGKSDYPKQAGPGFAYEGRRPDSNIAVFRAELRTRVGNL